MAVDLVGKEVWLQHRAGAHVGDVLVKSQLDDLELAGVALALRERAGPGAGYVRPGEVVRTLLLEPGEHELLAVLNDRTADGRDVSWVWDADLELLAPRLRRVTCSGTRAPELALRMKYAGVPEERIALRPELRGALDDALAGAPERLFVLPTYTAMLELRELLAARGVAARSFA